MGANEIFRPEVMKTIEETLTVLNSELRELSLRIHGKQSVGDHVSITLGLNQWQCCVEHPELGFQEKSVL